MDNTIIMEKKIEKGLKQLEVVNQWIANCDTKSSFLFTFYGVIITIIFSSDILKDILGTFHMHSANGIDSKSVRLFIALLVLIVFMVCICVTIYYILNTLRARINPKVYQETDLNTDSLLFFGSISEKTFQNFEAATNNVVDSAYLNDINSQVFINSKIAKLKFDNYNTSLIWAICSFFSFLLYLLLK